MWSLEDSSARLRGTSCTLFVISAFLCLALVSGCASLPADYARTETRAIKPSAETFLGRRAEAECAAHPGTSGFYIFPQGMDAFVARALLIEAAERALDLQYYIVQDGITTGLLTERILGAADRGVRVRFLIDDFGLGLPDWSVALLNSHPNIEVRLFNPVPTRRKGLARFFASAGNLRRLNHRMHNKALIVDNQMGIVGGRNLADEYFGASDDLHFADMDVMALGPVVEEVSRSFDDYWKSEWAVPLGAFLGGETDESEVREGRERLREQNRRAIGSPYVQGLRDTDFLRRLREGRIPFICAEGHAFSDRPEKIAPQDVTDLSLYLGPNLVPTAMETSSELILVSPYFVPGAQGVQYLGRLSEEGVRVRVLTNSLASTDVPAVYAGYARYRGELLRKGVELYEIRPVPGETDPAVRRRVLLASSRGSLHAKIYVFDRKTVFIGSRNLDPRSNLVNTEIGILIESPELARQVARIFDIVAAPEHSFRITVSGRNGIVWSYTEEGAPVETTRAPMTSFWLRFWSRILSVLAPESLL